MRSILRSSFLLCNFFFLLASVCWGQVVEGVGSEDFFVEKSIELSDGEPVGDESFEVFNEADEAVLESESYRDTLEAIVDVSPEGALGKGSENVVQALLISSVRTIQPGTPFWIGILLRMPPGWHIYWQHPGEMGMATTIDWDLPEGFMVHPGLWPTPLVLEEEEGVVSYAYFNEAPVLFELVPPEDLDVGKDVKLSVSSSWLECKNLCRPGEANLSIRLPVTPEAPLADPEGSYILEQSRDRGPQSIPADWTVEAFRTKDNELVLKVASSDINPLSEDIDKVYFYPFDDMIIPSAHQAFERKGNELLLYMEENPDRSADGNTLSGLLYTPNEWINGSLIGSVVIDKPIIDGPSVAGRKIEVQNSSFFFLVLMAFLGGLILNLMPCIFPLLGLRC